MWAAGEIAQSKNIFGRLYHILNIVCGTAVSVDYLEREYFTAQEIFCSSRNPQKSALFPYFISFLVF